MVEVLHQATSRPNRIQAIRADLFLLLKKADGRILVLSIYVDNACLFGQNKSVIITKDQIGRPFEG